MRVGRVVPGPVISWRKPGSGDFDGKLNTVETNITGKTIMKKIDQVFRIKRILAERSETVASMARKLNLPAGTVASNVYGFRANPETMAAIAGFLGKPVDQVFDAGSGS